MDTTPDSDESFGDAQSEHLAEQLGDGVLMTTPEPSKGRVVRALVGRHDPKGHIFDQPWLDEPRGPLAEAVRVEQHTDHERGVVGGSAATVLPVARIEARQIHLGDDVHDEPGQVALGQPVRNRRRHQEHLVAVSMTPVGLQSFVLSKPGHEVPRLADVVSRADDGRAGCVGLAVWGWLCRAGRI